MTALIIDLDLVFMNDHLFFTYCADRYIGIIPTALPIFKVLVAYQNISSSDAYRVLVVYQNIYVSSTINYWAKMLENILYVEETKVTVRKYRHRTTVPSKIFKLLKVKDGDILRWIATKDGKISVEKKSTK